MTMEKLMELVDRICEEYGFEDAPAYALLEDLTEEQIIEEIRKYNEVA